MIRTTARRGAALLLLLAPALARPTPCAECGMEVDPASRFSARVVRDGKELAFCDVGDLLAWLGRKESSAAGAEVRDHASGEWIAAEAAFYVRSEKAFRTPMRWSIAAFRTREGAAAYGVPMDLAGAIAAAR